MGVIDQLSPKEQGIWHTYVCQARRLTRHSIEAVKPPPVQLKPPETDDVLQCCRQSLPPEFSDSITSIVFSVFAAEFRINLAARMKTVSIQGEPSTEYLDKDDKSIKGDSGNGVTFWDLKLWEKWRNFPRACGRPDKKEYLDSVRRLARWVTLRNDIAHANPRRLVRSSITPQDALKCYEAVVDSIFELNILLYNDRKGNEESKRAVSLMP